MLALRASARPVPAVSAPVKAFSVPQVRVRPVLDARVCVIAEAQNSKRRQRVEARNAEYNKHYKELVKSSSRLVLRNYKSLLTTAKDIEAEAELQPTDQLLSKAFSNIDKAVVKGVMHRNTGARRKAKLTRARKRVLVAAGLYTPVISE